MTQRVEAVPQSVLKLLERLIEVGAMREFYLAGGTGLALLLDHRRSVDLDFFSRTNRLDREGRRDIVDRLRQLSGWQVTEAKDGTLHGRVGGVRISFFWYPEPLVKPFVHRRHVRIASLEDIGLMKLGAIIGRGSRKDFVDLYAICQHRPLARLLALAPKKFRRAGDFSLQALKALGFFEDAEREPPVVTPRPLSWNHVKTFFEREIRTCSARLLKG